MKAQSSRSAEPGGVKSVVVVGGGTAGWMAACLLAKKFERGGLSITVVESSEIGTVGVGEATVPAIRDFFKAIDLDDQAVLDATEGTIKLGIEFQGWKEPGHRFFHPFGTYGMPARAVAFHHYWLKLRQLGHILPLEEFCLCTKLAQAGLFLPPLKDPPNDLGVFDWAVHFDAARFADLLRGRARAAGVKLIDAKVVAVHLDTHSGDIASLKLDGGGTLQGDLYIDCSGFRGLLIGQALGVPYVDWRRYLPCDRAVAIPTASVDGAMPYTTSTARQAGWQWTIPLQHRVGNGYVYSGEVISDDEAIATLRAHVDGEPLAEPLRIRFTPGHRVRFWDRNCVAIGLAAGFLEPLESTSITMIQTAIEKLIDLFPSRASDPALAAEYNRTTTLEFERVRDFLILHYVGNRRVGEPFWDAMRSATLPEKLQHKINLFMARGKLVRYEWEAFYDPSWLSMYAGFGMMPAAYDPNADFLTEAELVAAMTRMRSAIDAIVSRASPHHEYLAKRRHAA